MKMFNNNIFNLFWCQHPVLCTRPPPQPPLFNFTVVQKCSISFTPGSNYICKSNTSGKTMK